MFSSDQRIYNFTKYFISKNHFISFFTATVLLRDRFYPMLYFRARLRNFSPNRIFNIQKTNRSKWIRRCNFAHFLFAFVTIRGVHEWLIHRDSSGTHRTLLSNRALNFWKWRDCACAMCIVTAGAFVIFSIFIRRKHIVRERIWSTGILWHFIKK